MYLLSRSSRASCAALLLAALSASGFAAAPLQGLATAAGIEPSRTSSVSSEQQALPPGAFESVLPADTLLWIGVDRVDGLRRHVAESSLGRMLQDAAMAPTLASLMRECSAWKAQLRAALGDDPTGLFEMLEGPAALAVAMPRDTQGTPTSTARRSVAVLLLADVGEHQREAAALLERVMTRLAGLDGRLEVGERLSGEVRLTTLSLWPCAASPPGGVAHDDDSGAPDGDDVDVDRAAAEDAAGARERGAPEAVLSCGFRGPLLVASFEWHPGAQRALDDVLLALDATPSRSRKLPPALASRADFAASLATTPGDVRCWADAGGFTRLVLDRELSRAAADAESRQTLEALGLTQLGTLSQSLSWDSDTTDWSAGIEWEGQGFVPRLMRLLCGSGATRTLACMPADCRSAVVGHVDLPGLFDTVVSMLLELHAATPAEITGALARAEGVLGFNPRDDLLELFDGELGIVTVGTDREDAFPGTALDPVNFGVLVGLTDGAALAVLVEAAIDASGLRAARRRESFEGMSIDHLTLLPPISLHYAILDDVLLASQSDALLHDMLRRHEHPELGSLATLPAFRVALERLPGPHGLLGYSDTAAQLESLIRSLKLLPDFMNGVAAGIHGADGDVVPWADGLDWLASLPLPDPALVRRYINSPTLTSIVVDEHGARLRSIGP